MCTAVAKYTAMASPSDFRIAYPQIRAPDRKFHDGYLSSAFSGLRTYCGSNTVAIDNKIEQAMDLVKSHLMFAVREEVEVLKEQIKELMERISQLEYENGVLRAAATPETLAKLSQPRSQLPPPSTS